MGGGGGLAPREILEIAQGGSRQREICMSLQILDGNNKVPDKQSQNTDKMMIFSEQMCLNISRSLVDMFLTITKIWICFTCFGEWHGYILWYLDILDPCANSMKLAVNRE